MSQRECWDGEIPVKALKPSKTNPRGEVPTESLELLAASIRRYGVFTRLLVRPLGKNPRIENGTWHGVRGWEIVLGERRWRAAQLTGLEVLPVTIQLLSNDEAEAIQRVDAAFVEPAYLSSDRHRTRNQRRLLGLPVRPNQRKPTGENLVPL